MIQKLNLRGLTNAEFYQLLKLVADQVSVADSTALKIKKAHDALLAKLPSLMTALNSETASQETKRLESLDEDRDDAIVGISMVINGYTYQKDFLIRETAQLLQSFLKAQGRSISKMNYQAQTSTLSKICEAFKTDPRYVPAIAQLGLTTWVNELDAYNRSFESAFKTRTTEQSQNADVLSFGKQKKEAIQTYNDLVDMIVIRYKAAQDDGAATAPYMSLISEINTLIDNYSAYIYKSRLQNGESPNPA